MVLIIVHTPVDVAGVRLQHCDLLVELLFKKELPRVHDMAVLILLCFISVGVIRNMYLHQVSQMAIELDMQFVSGYAGGNIMQKMNMVVNSLQDASCKGFNIHCEASAVS